MTSQKVWGLLIAFGFGFAIAIYAYFQVTDPEPARQRAREELVVNESRALLRGYIAVTPEIQIVDPLAPDRAIGKVYVFPAGDGWEVSGFYRRSKDDEWHAYLMKLDAQIALITLSVRDKDRGLTRLATTEEKLTVVP